MRFVLKIFVAVALSPGLHCRSWAADPPADRPNIIFILADDSGYADFGCCGHPYARTPNIDRLAAAGTCFRQFYSTGVTCCPSRTGFMTSRWPASYPTYPANGGFADRVTVTELLHKSGYATGHFGKWHIGPVAKPGTYGFDVVGTDGRNRKKKGPRGRDASIYDEAIKFVEQHQSGPFYMNVWSHISHHRVDPPQSYIDRFKDVVVDETKFAAPMQNKFTNCKKRGGDVSEHMRRYLADIFSMDEDIGRLLNRVDELGLRDKTIVVFSSDQGPAPLDATDERGGEEQNDSRLNAMGYVGALRGGKHTMYEGGVRVPFIVRWPGRVPANRVDQDSVTSAVDWLPTLSAIAGVKIEANDFEGEDVSAAWLGNATHTRARPLLWRTSSNRSSAAIREGFWKLIRPGRKSSGELELFDLRTDSSESTNVAAEHPDIVKALSAKVEAWVATLPKQYVKSRDDDN